jgi:hypothetical protein
VKWESGDWQYKADPSLRSFVFTLRNPNCSARKFALKAEAKDGAIICDSKWCPCFHDIRVFDQCNTNAVRGICLGDSYKNGSGLGGKIVLTGSECFRVKEIEVFEITD